jgi:hypothetical protein
LFWIVQYTLPEQRLDDVSESLDVAELFLLFVGLQKPAG